MGIQYIWMIWYGICELLIQHKYLILQTLFWLLSDPDSIVRAFL